MTEPSPVTSTTDPKIPASAVEVPEGFKEPLLTPLKHEKRTRLPRVFGIVAVFFSLFGLLMAVGVVESQSEDLAKYGLSFGDLGFFGSWSKFVYVGLSVALFLVHIAAAISSIGYKARSRWLFNLYGVLAIILLTVDLLISYTTFPETLAYSDVREVLHGRMGLAVFCLPWPVIVLVVFNDNKVRAALK